MPQTRPARKTTLQVQHLEDRCTPAILGLLDNGGTGVIAAFNPSLPSSTLGMAFPTLSPGGLPVEAMDLRPGTTLLYGIAVNPNGSSDVGTLVALDLSRGNLTWNQVPTVGAQIQLFNGVLGGGGNTVVDTAWNPATGHLQIIDDFGDSYEFDPATSAVSQDHVVGPRIAGIAYVNGTLYGYQEAQGATPDTIVAINTFTGVTTPVNTVRSLGNSVRASNYELVGLAGDGAGHLYANIDVQGSNQLWLLNLQPNQDSTLLGQFAGNVSVRDIAFIPDSLASPAQATGASLVRSGKRVTGVRVTFNKALDPTTAQAASGYVLQVLRGTGKHRRKVTLSPGPIVYDAADHSVTLSVAVGRNDRSLTVTVVGGGGGNALFTLGLPRHR